MVTLQPYTPRCAGATLRRIAQFWGFHAGLVNAREEADSAAEDLALWTGEDHFLYVIFEDGADAGFLHLARTGPLVMELADLFVDEERRGRGVATAAIALAEQAARRTPGVQAMTVAAAPRNTAALRLYRRLGYDSLCLVTLRKEFGPNPRDKRCEFLGLSFCI